MGWLIYLQTDNIYYFGIGVGIGIVIAVLARIFWRTPHRRDGDGDNGSGFSDFFDGDSGGND
ncbi:MAG: hypothetical protein HC893_09365 [Chloroflexaceae bacterium]|nr:hypothetical protein [Chloroflexaceae bacterium]